ncbi:hypothetical protein GCM10022406_39830 [Hymenobacter algoricola]|uniref:Uncharacterized protein n=2 Tax=Hymenobacter algoricola TaxID=486267 RepID=A0ABP7NUE1_9BACT
MAGLLGLLLIASPATYARPAPHSTRHELATAQHIDVQICYDVTVATAAGVVDTQRFSAQRPAASVATVAPRSQATKFNTYHQVQLRSRWVKRHGQWYKVFYKKGQKHPYRADIPVDPGRSGSNGVKGLS